MLVLFSFLLSGLVYSQEVIIELSHAKNLFVDFHNHIDVKGFDVPCEDLHIEADNGVAYSFNENCDFYIIPKNTGKVNLKFYERNTQGTKYLKTITYTAVNISDSKMYLANSSGQAYSSKYDLIKTGKISLSK